MNQTAPVTNGSRGKRSSKEVTTIVSFRIAGRMKTEEDMFIGIVGAKNLAAAKRMTVADLKGILADQHQVSIDAIELYGVWGEREAKEKAAAVTSEVERIIAPLL